MIRTGSLDHYSAAVVLAAITLCEGGDVDPEDEGAVTDRIIALDGLRDAVRVMQAKTSHPRLLSGDPDLDLIMSDPEVATAIAGVLAFVDHNEAPPLMRPLVETVIRTQDAFTNRAIVEAMHDRAAWSAFRDRALRAERELARLHLNTGAPVNDPQLDAEIARGEQSIM